MIKEWIAGYKPRNADEARQALREIMQEIALAGLSRGGFFEKAAFYGGTALRIFHGLDRFSEDLDFSLLKASRDFSLDPYFSAIETEFDALGLSVSIREKRKKQSSNIDSAFLKSDTVWRELIYEGAIPQIGLDHKPTITIKLEVDLEPPGGFETEDLLLVKPVSFYVKCFTLPHLFAGKMHALLFRKWKENVKGRDWYDMEWYIKKGVALDLDHFLMRARDSGDWKKHTIAENEFHDLLKQKITTVNMDRVKADISRFIANPVKLDIWSPGYFQDLAKHLKFSRP
jgi:hypothetical protein